MPPLEQMFARQNPLTEEAKPVEPSQDLPEQNQESATEKSFRDRVVEQASVLGNGEKIRREQHLVPSVDEYKNIADLADQIKEKRTVDGKRIYRGPNGELLPAAYARRLLKYRDYDWSRKNLENSKDKELSEDDRQRHINLAEYWDKPQTRWERRRRARQHHLGGLALAGSGLLVAAGAWAADKFKSVKNSSPSDHLRRAGQTAKQAARNKVDGARRGWERLGTPAQPTSKKNQGDKTDYEKKKRDADRAAAVILLAGTAALAGALIYANQNPGENHIHNQPSPGTPGTTQTNNPPIGGHTLHPKHRGSGPSQTGNPGQTGGKHQAEHPTVSDVQPGDYLWNVLARDGVTPGNIMPALHHAGHVLAERTGADVDWHGGGKHEWVEVNGNSHTKFLVGKLGKFVVVNR